MLELRLVVVRSAVLSYASSNALICFDGGDDNDDNTTTTVSIGRDRSYVERRIRLPEMLVSRYHAYIYYAKNIVTNEINYDDEPQQTSGFYLVDTGSTHGTFVNDQRLSPAKESSLPKQLHHGDTITIGSTTFNVHIHQLGSCCEACSLSNKQIINIEPSTSTTKEPSSSELLQAMNTKTSLEKERKRINSQLRRKFEPYPTIETQSTPIYRDRAQERRAVQGPDTQILYNQDRHDVKNVVTAETIQYANPIEAYDPENKGLKMLEKMGWKRGTGLGKERDGTVDPIIVKGKGDKQDRTGLG